MDRNEAKARAEDHLVLCRGCDACFVCEVLLDSLKREEALEKELEDAIESCVKLHYEEGNKRLQAQAQRAEQAEARLKSLVEKAEAVLWLAKHGAVPEGSVTMQALRAELDKLREAKRGQAL